jgi:hypothetical protein
VALAVAAAVYLMCFVRGAKKRSNDSYVITYRHAMIDISSLSQCQPHEFHISDDAVNMPTNMPSNMLPTCWTDTNMSVVWDIFSTIQNLTFRAKVAYPLLALLGSNFFTSSMEPSYLNQFWSSDNVQSIREGNHSQHHKDILYLI